MPRVFGKSISKGEPDRSYAGNISEISISIAIGLGILDVNLYQGSVIEW